MVSESAVIIGVGARLGVGAAIAVKAAREGLHVFIAGRTPAKLDLIVDEIVAAGGQATAVIMDCTIDEDITALFEQVSNSGTVLRLVVYNTGRNLPAPFMEHDVRLIEGHWRRCVLGGMLVGQAAIRLMQQHIDENHGDQLGTILYTGASASMRGKPLFSGFASAKAALRAMVQSMAREFGPQGIHIGHIVIDGVIDGDVIRSVKGLGKLALKLKGEDGALRPDEIAQAFWMLHRQQPNSWTHEIDLRPFKEAF
ncbi:MULTISPECIES: SDR family NAD(P)-dependent oxidoreductase [Marinobacter]|uniref:SDR family NAD(P)-dependent oxidoreductase n=1 Tax=Marinobacter TaxID=2742 RepID=UPI001D0919DD|nr:MULTISPECIES: SDR family NAD(P)-dependent oxidoreductase [Marinobacter]MCK7568629.1 SDR family NAD(P)-dependent oxidoreductase [Marinobacter xestospongiae]UDL07064.1 SDR family NAD(P)-dependent oxidoreductase [Marinobacter sp. CA1]